MLYIIQNWQPGNTASTQEETYTGSLLLVISSSESDLRGLSANMGRQT